MEHVLQDFGTGLLAYLRRNPRWDADSRALVRVEWTPTPEEQTSSRQTPFALVALIAGVVAQLAG